MKRYLRHISVLLLLLLVPELRAQEVYTISVKGVQMQFLALTETTVAVGDGYNPSIDKTLEKDVTIPATITVGGSRVMTVTEVSDNAFRECAITGVTIGPNVSKLSFTCFRDCMNLTQVDIPGNVKLIGNGAFYCCRNLTRVAFHEGLEVIQYSAFGGTGLSSVDLPESLQTLGYECFSGTFTSFHLPKNVHINSDYTPIADNSELQSFTVDPENPYYTSKDNVLFTKDMSELVAYPAGRTEETYYTPSEVKQINWYAFNEARVKNLKLNEGLEELGWSCFFCSDIENIVLPQTLTTIDVGVFIGCHHLTTLTFPASLTTFRGNPDIPFSVKTVYFDGETPPTLLDDFWGWGFEDVETIYVPMGCASNYVGKPWDELNIVEWDEPYPLYIDGLQLTRSMSADLKTALQGRADFSAGGSLSYSKPTRTLTLNEVSLLRTSSTAPLQGALLYSELDSLNIVLKKGSNLLTLKGAAIKSTGTVRLCSGQAGSMPFLRASSTETFGLEVEGHLIVDGVNLEAIGKTVAISGGSNQTGRLTLRNCQLSTKASSMAVDNLAELNQQGTVFSVPVMAKFKNGTIRDYEGFALSKVQMVPGELYDMTVAGCRVSDKYAEGAEFFNGTVAYDHSTRTLTLSDIINEDSDVGEFVSATLSAPLTISLVGENRMACAVALSLNGAQDMQKNPLVTISGDGSLEVNSISNSVLLNGVDLRIKNTSVKCSADYGYGICGQSALFLDEGRKETLTVDNSYLLLKGVDTPAYLGDLKLLGCDLYQGPIPGLYFQSPFFRRDGNAVHGGVIINPVDMPTRIASAAAAVDTDVPLYNLNGQHVKEVSMPGIYIKNGRKVVRK